MSKWVEILSIIRIKNVIIAFLCSIITLHKIKFNIIAYDSIVSILIVLLLIIGSNIINDFYDIRTDKINKPDRLLVKNATLKRPLIIIVLFMCICSLLLSFTLNINSLLIVIISLPLLLLYTPFFKKIPLIGNIFVAFFLALVFVFIAVSTQNHYDKILPAASIAFSISLIREIIKDIEDYNGDKKTNINTIAVYLGIKPAIYLSCFLIVCFIIQCIYFIQYDFLNYYTLSLIFLVFLPLFYLIYFLIKSPSIDASIKAASLLKKITILGLLIIYII